MASPALTKAASKARAAKFWDSPAPYFIGAVAALFVLGVWESNAKKAAAASMQGPYFLRSY